MLVSELEGAQMDCWVAKAQGIDDIKFNFEGRVLVPENKSWTAIYSPSTNWAQGGPIIEREIAHITRHGPTRWSALANGSAPGHGSTPLIAAMRAYVASKFGDEVPDEAAP